MIEQPITDVNDSGRLAIELFSSLAVIALLAQLTERLLPGTVSQFITPEYFILPAVLAALPLIFIKAMPIRRSDVIWSTVIMVIVAGLIVKTLTLNYFTGIIFTLLAVCLSLGMVWQS
ncbi:MAG: hypothetical protein V1838_02525, partial [Patescibacteria group bacterium]